MTYAAHLSASILDFRGTEKVVDLLSQYQLPTYASFDRSKVFDVLKHDKKRERNQLHYILLQKIGHAVVHTLPLGQVEQIIDQL